jgi:hypothetical protein
MSETMENSGDSSEPNISIQEALTKAQSLLYNEAPTAPSPNNERAEQEHGSLQALSLLTKLQERIHQLALLSNNESLEDTPTSSLILLSVEYHMAKAHAAIPVFNPNTKQYHSRLRQDNIRRAVELFTLFLDRVSLYEEVLFGDVSQRYQTFSSQIESQEDASVSLKPLSRDETLVQHKLVSNLQKEVSHMKALMQQRKRLGVDPEEELELHTSESLLRAMYVNQLNEWVIDAMKEIGMYQQELTFLKMRVERDAIAEKEQTYSGRQAQERREESTASRRMGRPGPNAPKMDMTQVTQDPSTGELIFTRQHIQSQVFRPSWNQPTMTLEELADREVADAIKRDENQKKAELENKSKPRRYEFLVRDGMEDDKDLVDASAKIDREWDNWKDDNPRGSGNKMGDRGDRNF